MRTTDQLGRLNSDALSIANAAAAATTIIVVRQANDFNRLFKTSFIFRYLTNYRLFYTLDSYGVKGMGRPSERTVEKRADLSTGLFFNFNSILESHNLQVFPFSL